MNGQWGSGALFYSSRPPLSSSPISPPTVKLLVCPISRSHWYILPPLEIILGSYVKMSCSNINKMSCIYLFVFLFLFYMFICILVYEFQSLKL